MQEKNKNKKNVKIIAALCAKSKEKNYIKFVDTYIINLINDLKNYYTPKINYTKNIQEVIDWLINDVIEKGKQNDYIPVICGYNMFDYTRAIIYELRTIVNCEVIARNESNFFVATFLLNDEPILKFWDIMHLIDEEKLFEETNIKEKELSIPKYLQILLKRNDFIKEYMLSYGILTKASLTRQYAKSKIGKLYYTNANNHYMKLIKANNLLCTQNQPYNYKCYALRKSCFIGGYCFVSAKYSNKIHKRIYNIDANSMHHAQICGHFVPVKFRPAPQNNILKALKEIQEMDDIYLMKYYDRPFHVAFHCKINVEEVKLKHGSLFENNVFGLLHREKFKNNYESSIIDEKRLKAEEETKKNGFKFYAENQIFAFGKLLSAEKLSFFCNEIEFWNFCQVYDFKNLSVEFGEISTNFVRPSDFITLQTNMLYLQKEQVKKLLKYYIPGKKYLKKIPYFIPEYLKQKIKNGIASKNELKIYYTEDIKTRFNCIYGNQAQDVYLPEYEFTKNFSLKIDKKTIAKEKNFHEKLLEKEPGLSVHYNFGLRISSWSRTHLILALIQLYKKDNKIKILSGDTDSIHFCSNNKEILKSLNILHNSIDRSINETTKRVNKCFEKQTTNLKGIGHFELENISKKRIDYCNKVYLSQNNDNSIEFICAGLPQKEQNKFNIKNVLQLLIKKYGFDKVATEMIGFNTLIDKEITDIQSYIINPNIYIKGTKKPTMRRFYKSDYDLLSLAKIENIENIKILQKYNKNDLTTQKIVRIENGKPKIEILDILGEIKTYGLS